ncbi:hypothetical protein PoB_002783500 [Plakobranchus ocellatus]|uniref:Secreted protein n=1 Tax=Plakobranchus ocellatus TaxID=259542 RepID=A0AAV3ZZN1_9GAST|nr:hypothetical protein PoB_002783500 [Plakobranchus ocellatus]
MQGHRWYIFYLLLMQGRCWYNLLPPTHAGASLVQSFTSYSCKGIAGTSFTSYSCRGIAGTIFYLLLMQGHRWYNLLSLTHAGASLVQSFISYSCRGVAGTTAGEPYSNTLRDESLKP